MGEQNEEWHEIRSVVQQDMLRPKSAMFYLDSLQEVSKDFLAKAEEHLDSNREVPGLSF